jgi:23S rRNA pseudouridine2605 synthase
MSKPSTGTVRLQKYLADAGLASRRKAEEIIQSGRVKVNGAVVKELGTKVTPGRDLVVVDGKPLERNAERRYILLYKPPGCVTTLSDPQGRPTARGYLSGVEERVFPVGRLDYDAEGALLFTDDGELANRLAHPRYGHRRVYLVKTKGVPDEGALRRMVEGVRLEDGPAKALSVGIHEKVETNTWIKIVVGEGRFHLVKRLCESVGLPVLRLYRPEFGGITVARLRPGHWRDLTPDEIKTMRAAVGMEGGEPGRTAMAIDLPKAGRRHGHGPPSQAATHAGTRRPGHAGDQREFEENNEPAGTPARHDRSERPVRGERPERPERQERTSRAERPARADRPARGQRPERRERSDRPERAGRTERPGQAARPQRPGRTDRSEQPPQSRRPERPGRVERPERADRTVRPDRAGRIERLPHTKRPPPAGRSERPGQTGRTGRTERSSGTARPERPGRPPRRGR